MPEHDLDTKARDFAKRCETVGGTKWISEIELKTLLILSQILSCQCGKAAKFSCWFEALKKIRKNNDDEFLLSSVQINLT